MLSLCHTPMIAILMWVLSHLCPDMYTTQVCLFDNQPMPCNPLGHFCYTFEPGPEYILQYLEHRQSTPTRYRSREQDSSLAGPGSVPLEVALDTMPSSMLPPVTLCCMEGCLWQILALRLLPIARAPCLLLLFASCSSIGVAFAACGTTQLSACLALCWWQASMLGLTGAVSQADHINYS